MCVTPALRLRKGESYNFGSTELPFNRTITSIAVTAGSAGDDGFARAIDQDGYVAVLIGLGKAGSPYGQRFFKSRRKALRTCRFLSFHGWWPRIAAIAGLAFDRRALYVGETRAAHDDSTVVQRRRRLTPQNG
jgi:hypothetical protein